jgi:hypothetical protein
MQALAQTFETFIAVMACTAFAHFGVALKAPCAHGDHAAHRTPISAPASVRMVRPNAPDTLATTIRRA